MTNQERELGAAVDEIYDLRALVALVITKLRGDLDLKTYPMGRRAESQTLIRLGEHAAKGRRLYGRFDHKKALAAVGDDGLLTNNQWLVANGFAADRDDNFVGTTTLAFTDEQLSVLEQVLADADNSLVEQLADVNAAIVTAKARRA